MDMSRDSLGASAETGVADVARAEFEIPAAGLGGVLDVVVEHSSLAPAFVYERRDPRSGLALTSWIGIRATSQVIPPYEDSDPFDELRGLVSKAAADGSIDGVFAFIGYPQPEHLAAAAPVAHATPRAIFLIPDEYVRLDHRRGTGVYVRRGAAGEESFGEWTAEEIAAAFARRSEVQRAGDTPEEQSAFTWSPITTEHAYVAHLRSAQDVLASDPTAGVVLSVRLSSRTAADPLRSYRALRRINPSPCMFLLCDSEFGLWGATSLSLVEITDRHLVAETDGATAPVAPLGESRMVDSFPNPKEVKEYEVVVDALRGDLLSVAAPGSLTFTSEMEHREFFGLRHLFAQAQADIASGQDAIDVVQALYPHGAAVGYPRPLALRLIDELESHPRGPFAGVVGMFDVDGGADVAAVIRSMWSTPHGSFVQAGAKVVDASQPAAEYRECILKTAALRQSARPLVAGG